MRRLALTLAIVVLAGCAGTAPTPQIIFVTAPPASAPTPQIIFVTPAPVTTITGPSLAPTPPATSTPAPTATLKPSPSPRPTVPPTPEASAAVSRGELFVIEVGDTAVSLIQVITNEGTAWADVDAGSFTIFADDGSVLDTGDATAAPRFLAPGETGYLVATATARSADVGEVEVSGEFGTAEGTPPGFPVTRVKYSKGSLGDRVTGLIENDSGKDQGLFRVVAILLSSAGRPLAWDYTFLTGFPAGKTVAFELESFGSTKGVTKAVVFGSPSFF